MYRVTLSDDQRRELSRRARAAGLAPSTRDRLEMVRLADAGWSPPRIAAHLRQHEQTVRTWLKAFLAGGFDALVNKPRGGKTSRLTPARLEAVRRELSGAGRTWSAPQIADWLAERHGLRLSADRTRVHLRRAGLTYQRTSRTLRHKQDTAQVADKQASLRTLERGLRPG